MPKENKNKKKAVASHEPSTSIHFVIVRAKPDEQAAPVELCHSGVPVQHQHSDGQTDIPILF